MQLTRQQAIQEHRRMWCWIANESERLCIPVCKHTYLNNFFDRVFVMSDCFLCDYSHSIRNSVVEKTCNYCPLSWSASGKERCIAGDCDGYYDLWSAAYTFGDYIEAARLARIIANLPEKRI